MLRYTGRRLLALVPLLLLVTLISFLLVDLAPGDAAVAFAGDQASPEQIAQIRAALNLDDPMPVRYARFVGSAIQGDLGSSIFNSQSVMTMIGDRIWVSVSLAGLALAFAIVLGVSAGMLAAVRRGTWLDRSLSALAGFGLAVPGFVLSIFMLRWFALSTNWFPAGGYVPFNDNPAEWFQHLVLPAIALSAFPAAQLARLTRTSVADTLGRDYIQTAQAKGLPFYMILFKHSAKNAAIPVVTTLGVTAGLLFGAGVIVEKIFNLPGLGSLTVSSVLTQDVPVIQGLVLSTSVIVVAINFLTDLTYGYFNPKIRA